MRPRLPLLLSVPHAGRRIPHEVADSVVLGPADVEADGDVGAARIYDLADKVDAYVTTDVARAVVDMNRGPDDIRKDGVVKTHTCWDVPVYREPLSPELTRLLVDRYHAPYHERLRDFSGRVVAGVDCHTMAAVAPPEAPDPGEERPWMCLSDADGTLPREWLDALSDALETAFGVTPSINEPFQGGYIIRHHSRELPWVQLELSRAPFWSLDEKRGRVLAALRDWVETLPEPVPHAGVPGWHGR